MIKLQIRRAWFKKEKVDDSREKAERRFLKSGGAIVRKIARDFVRHRSDPNKNSEPFHSPYDHFGLKKSIVFGLDGRSVVIGPRHIKDGLSNAARLHEYGGKAMRRVVRGDFLRDGVKIGDYAPVSVSRLSKRKDRSIVRQDNDIKDVHGRKSVWIRIRTKTQAEHATRLYRRQAKNIRQKQMVTYLPRPYMHPALNKALPSLAPMWKNAFNG